MKIKELMNEIQIRQNQIGKALNDKPAADRVCELEIWRGWLKLIFSELSKHDGEAEYDKHVGVGETGGGGQVMMEGLIATAEKLGARIVCDANARQLVVDPSGRVVGLRYTVFGEDRTVRANKGVVIERMSNHFRIPLEQIATLGDQPNDVLMFNRSGLSIAMGNANAEVQQQATCVTASYEDEGFAKAIEEFVLPHAASAPHPQGSSYNGQQVG